MATLCLVPVLGFSQGLKAPALTPSASDSASPAGFSQPSRSEAASSADASNTRGTARRRIGLALSGGGARGFAHVGVLRALEALRVPVDCIAGTSAGSAVGAAYASGLSPDEIEAQLRSVDWDREMFKDDPPRRDQPTRRKNEEKAFLFDITVGIRDGSVQVPSGLVAGQKIELFLHKMLGSSTVLDSFDRLPIPFRAMTTDIETGQLVVQDHGSLPAAIRASMAVPSAFSPVEIDGRLLVDGGLTRNMPVDIVRDLCGDSVIAVDIGSPLLKRDQLGTLLSVAGQMIGVLMERNMQESRAQVRPGQDVMIRPELGDIGAASFSRGVDGIPAGVTATEAVADQLRPLALSETDYAEWKAARAARIVRNNQYSGVRMVGSNEANRRALLALTQFPASGELNTADIDARINRWNALGNFERISYSLVPTPPGQTLEISLTERSWGPNYLRFGMGASADTASNGFFNLLVGYRRPDVNSFGGEFKTELQVGTLSRFYAELFQPFNRGASQWFVVPNWLSEQTPIWVYNGNKRVAEYGVRTNQAGLDFGVQGRYGEGRIGIFAGKRNSFPRTGSITAAESKDNYYGGQLTLVADQLDATDFPRDGYVLGASFRAEQVDSDLGGNYSNHRAEIYGKQVVSFGDHTFAASIRMGEGDNKISLNQAFSLGGFMNLSGLQLNQILGTSLRYGSLSYQNQLYTLPDPLGRGIYGGFALEGGRMDGLAIGLQQAGWIYGATAFIGAHTAIGPVYLGYGYAQGNNRLFYLFLGRPGL